MNLYNKENYGTLQVDIPKDTLLLLLNRYGTIKKLSKARGISGISIQLLINTYGLNSKLHWS